LFPPKNRGLKLGGREDEQNRKDHAFLNPHRRALRRPPNKEPPHPISVLHGYSKGSSTIAPNLEVPNVKARQEEQGKPERNKKNTDNHGIADNPAKSHR